MLSHVSVSLEGNGRMDRHQRKTGCIMYVFWHLTQHVNDFFCCFQCAPGSGPTTPSLPFLKVHSYLRLSLTGGSSSLSRLVAIPRQTMIAMAITLLACFSDGYYEPLKGAHMNLARPECYRQAYRAEAVIKLSNWILSER